MFNEYPYRNLTDLNLDYILNAIKTFQNDVTNFVSINAIKYANPIQWDITRQYEKNTIVIDPVSGTAYISVAPVPAGVALTRTEYWTVVFDLSLFIVRAAKNFTIRYESDTTLTATFPTTKGDWLVWGDTLYVANVNITAGDSYVIDGNIRHITVEEVKNAIYQYIQDNYDAIIDIIGSLDDLTTTAKDNIVAAINELKTTIDNEVLARQEAVTALQDAIDAEVQARQVAIDTEVQARQVAIDTEVQARQVAIDAEVQARQEADTALSDKIGNLLDLKTIVKTDTVESINDLVSNSDIYTKFARKRIAVIGDSMSMEVDTRYMTYARVFFENLGCTVENFSVGGATANDIYNKINTELVGHTPYDIIIIQISGMNDVLAGTPYGFVQGPNAGTFVKSVIDAIAYSFVSNQHADIYVLGCTCQSAEYLNTITCQYNTRTYAHLVESACAVLGVKYLDMSILPFYRPATNFPWSNDGIHLKGEYGREMFVQILDKMLAGGDNTTTSLNYSREYNLDSNSSNYLACPYIDSFDSECVPLYAMIGDLGNGFMEMHLQFQWRPTAAGEKELVHIADHFGPLNSILGVDFGGVRYNMYDTGIRFVAEDTAYKYINMAAVYQTANSPTYFRAMNR